MADINNFIEVTLGEQDDFLKVRETLTRIGVKIINPDRIGNNVAPLHQIKIISFKEKDEWNLVAKYNIGKKPDET